MFSSRYDFQLTEKNKNLDYWQEIIKLTSENFTGTLLLPPPNITGNLHLGHALDSVSQDFLVRFSVLTGQPIYWIAGIDHAGISTQSKIENLKITNLDTNEKKREYTWKIWYPQTRQNFSQQWQKLGLLIDYDNAKFTLDPIIQQQVKEAFVKLYQDGLIYRGKRLVNWDPQLESVISDIEVEHKISQSKLYYLKYPLLNSEEYLPVATSRPETIFADVALFVNPQDRRYKKHVGESVKHPFTEKTIPILADESIKMDFGSGVLKCTPGHDLTDYELGKKYNLPIMGCCEEKGILNELAGRWQGQKINNIREELVRELEREGICLKIENYETNLSYSSKSGSLVEPLLSQQWFLDLSTLIKKIERKKPDFLAEIAFFPPHFAKTLKEWKEKIHEWCLSRQLWWGHQIPVWYHKKTGEIYVGIKSPEKKEDWEPEKDVLDTWFSSGLWPLVVSTKEEGNFPSPSFKCYPITTLITGYDILFFWVLKMILLGTYFTDQVPFQQILLHGLIRDKHGKKMSKSLGNGVEPDMLIEKYGCDSLRLFLLENNIWGSDLVYQEEKIIGSWRFCQKLWSIANLITSKISSSELRKVKKADLTPKNLVNQWLLNELEALQNSYFASLRKNKWEISTLTGKLIKFVREKLSNNYLELIKIYPTWNKETKDTVLFAYQQLLMMFHPIIPFITEYIYQIITGKKLLSAQFEKIRKERENNDLWQIDCLLLLVKTVRSQNQKKDIADFYLELTPQWEKKFASKNFDFNQFLEPLIKTRLTISEKIEKEKLLSEIDLAPFGVLKYQETINYREEELNKKLAFCQQEWERSKKLLENNNFLAKSPFSLVEKEKNKLNYYQKRKEDLLAELKKIKKTN
jgi:valyl-tRNA synthetase